MQRTGAFVTVYFRAISYCCKSDSSAQERVGVANQSFSPLANMMDDVDEPMCENSDDDLGDSDDEARYIAQAQTHKNTCKMPIYYSVHEARKNYLCILMLQL